MARLLHVLFLAGSACAVFGQETTPTSVKVVKSDAMEMKSGDPAPTPSAGGATAVALGDFTSAPAVKGCGDLKEQPRLDCSAEKVLAAIRGQVGAPALDMKAFGASPVTVTFVVNQFGDVKDIRVEHPGDVALNKAVTLALYGLPRLVPASKGTADVIASLQFKYPYSELFVKP
ncbi:MAG: hypothetical protein ABI432_14110 [Flavobacteriales bacterium]